MPPVYLWRKASTNGRGQGVAQDWNRRARSLDWRPEWHSVYEQIYFGGVRGGAPTREAAEHLARKLRDILWRRHEEERVRAELDSHRVLLDLNALIPIPQRVLRKGFVEAGQEWMWANWGVRWPIRRDAPLSMSSIKRDVKKKVLPRPEAERIFVSRSSPLHCKSASRFAREVLLLSCLPFL